MNTIDNQKTFSANSVFTQRFLSAKMLFLYCFNALPSIHYLSGINGEKAYKAFCERFADRIRDQHIIRGWDKKRRKYDFDETLLVMEDNVIVEFDEGYCEILHDGGSEAFVTECTALLQRFKNRERRQPLEINLVVAESSGMYLKSMEIKRNKLDLSLFYEDDFCEVDALIQQRLRKRGDKGIVLLHGLPGTGKTTYLRYLIGRIRKRVLFMPPGMAASIMNPEFIELMIDNPDTVVIIEDAETIITDRRTSHNSAVSNLLNISDGLLSDFLNVQLICTFNSALTMVDSALLRKGRLIAKYEFGKLGVAKAQVLSNHLGHNRRIDKPLTIAEIANPHEPDPNVKTTEIVGFKLASLDN